MQSVTSIDVPTNLLKMPIIKNKDIMEKKYEYDKVGTNQNVIVEPAVVKFCGFEIGKLNEIKVRVINKNKQPQRIYVFPPKSEIFNVKFDKKGAIPSGMAEELYVQFKPQEYKYFYDVIRINTQDDTLLIPIHAYPALSRDGLRELFPRLIDFGTLDIGESQTYSYPIQSKVPLNFEFEFNITKDCQDIKIEPIKGIVPGKGGIDISITYSPQVNVTEVMEVELKIAQFDFEPLCIKIMGSGRFPENKKTLRPSSTKKLKSITNSSRPKLLQNTQEIPIGESPKPGETQQIENQVQERSKTLKMTKSNKLKRSQSQQQESNDNIGIDKLKGRQLLEKSYLDHFNQIQSLDKEKEMRFFQCVGDPPINESQVQDIILERQQYLNNYLEDVQAKGTTRYKLLINADSTIVDYILPENQLSWDLDKNDTMKIKKLNLRKFVCAASRVIYKLRMEKRLQKLKAFLKGATTRAEVRQLVNLDCQKAEYSGVGKKDFVKFTFEFNSENIGFLKLPVQYSESNTNSSFKYTITPQTGFDDLAPFDELPSDDCEIMQYKVWEYPQIVYHPPVIEKPLRDGAEEEKSLRGIMGPVTQILQTQTQNDNLVRKIFSKPPEVESYQILKAHKTLRLYQQFNDGTPLNTFYPLMFSKVNGIGADLDPEIAQNHQILKQEFVNRTPGYQNLNLLYELPLDQFYYQEKNMQLSYDYGFDEQIEFYCPTIMPEKELDDYMTDDDSDEDKPPQINVADQNDWLIKLEQDDKTITNLRQLEIIDSFEQLKEKLDSNLILEKNKWISTVPSKTNDFNKFTVRNENKMVIL
ncbi:unnamed protein product [Paramecium pentaurelia]|uniref:Uncharacterized protein n=1 Tax=Paramecium pentaurelia TaxID=43138 RepID=A0A8S1SYM6_9CILI|nr:unnamed protein product [Paramecium pentaurelia]